VTDVDRGSREGGHTVALVDYSRVVQLGAAHDCLGWLSMEAFGSSYECGSLFMEGMNNMTVINENPPLKTTPNKTNGLKTVETHNLDSKIENSTNTIF
jgi:hypothetical protein